VGQTVSDWLLNCILYEIVFAHIYIVLEYNNKISHIFFVTIDIVKKQQNFQ
jgi:hypothetical protein